MEKDYKKFELVNPNNLDEVKVEEFSRILKIYFKNFVKKI